MKKYLIVAVLLCGVLAGCGSSNYSIIGRQIGTRQITYRVKVATGTTQTEAQEIAQKLRKGDEDKIVMVNFYDGDRSVDNLIYTCTDGSCYDAQPGR